MDDLVGADPVLRPLLVLLKALAPLSQGCEALASAEHVGHLVQVEPRLDDDAEKRVEEVGADRGLRPISRVVLAPRGDLRIE